MNLNSTRIKNIAWPRTYTVGTIDLGTNLSEPTSECGLGNRENPLNPQRPSRARSTENPSRVKYVVPFVDLNFVIFRIS